MKYVAFDIETSSLIPSPDHVLQIGLVIEDTETAHSIPVENLPTLSFIIKHNEIKGQPYALAMNAWILDILSGRNKNHAYALSDLAWAIGDVRQFLRHHLGAPRYVIAGKNVAGFDMQFMPPEFKECFIHRVIDVGSVFADFNKARPPSLEEVKAMCGINTPVAHEAVMDCQDVIRCLRTKYVKPE